MRRSLAPDAAARTGPAQHRPPAATLAAIAAGAAVPPAATTASGHPAPHARHSPPNRGSAARHETPVARRRRRARLALPALAARGPAPALGQRQQGGAGERRGENPAGAAARYALGASTSSTSPPTLRAEITVPASVVGPPTSVAITPDEKLALVTANQRPDPAEPGKLVPGNTMSVIDLTATPPRILATLPPAPRPPASRSTAPAPWRWWPTGRRARSASSASPMAR